VYKKNSQNMQRRAARITAKDLPAGGLTQDQLQSAAEERRVLGLRKTVLSRRVSELKAKMGIKPGVGSNQIKGSVTRTRVFNEWRVLVEELNAIEARIGQLPKPHKVGMNGLICGVLQELHPEVYALCRAAALDKARKLQVIIEGEDS
jgi:hypothetical protein